MKPHIGSEVNLLHCTGRYEPNKLTSLPMCGFIAQLVEHRTGIAEVTGSNPVEALICFFRLLLSNCLNWKFTAAISVVAKMPLMLDQEFGSCVKRPSHGKLKLANSFWLTQVGVCAVWRDVLYACN